MTPEKTLQALDEYAQLLTELSTGLKPERFPANIVPTLRLSLLRHALWMCEEAKKSAGSDKAQRWLGFIQGVIWCATPSSIDRLKTMNRPAESSEPKNVSNVSQTTRYFMSKTDWEDIVKFSKEDVVVSNPSLSKEALRLYVFLFLGDEGEDGPDVPAEELSYRVREVSMNGMVSPPPGETSLLRFEIFRTQAGVEKLLTYWSYPLSQRATAEVEQLAIEGLAVLSAKEYARRAASFSRLQDLVRAAGKP